MHPLPELKRISPYLVLVILTLWCLFLYRQGMAALPAGDHWLFVEERAFEPSNFHFVWDALSLARHRKLGFSNDSFLFRPGMTGALALLDVFFRTHLKVLGLFSIVWHAAACLALFLLLRGFIDDKIALGFALVFATQYAGKDMILWRHISPYILALFFFTLGLRGITLGRRSAAWCFFIASLFHEIVPLFCLGYGTALFVLGRIRRAGDTEARAEWNRLARSFLLPALAYALLNALDWAWLLDGKQWPTTLHEAYSSADWGGPLLLTSGLFFTASFLPWTIDFNFTNPLGKPRWDFPRGLEPLYRAEGVVLLLALAALLAFSAWQFRRTRERRQLALNVLVAFYLCFILAYAGYRIRHEGIAYLLTSTYYFYFSGFLTVGIAALAGVPLLRRLPPVTRTVCFGLGLLYLAGEYHALQLPLRRAAGEAEAMADNLRNISRTLTGLQGYCYGGTASEAIATAVPPKLLLYQSCALTKGIPLYVVETAEHDAMLMARDSDPDVPAEPLEVGPAEPIAPAIRRRLTHASYPLEGAAITFPPNFSGTWILGFRDEGNFILMRIHDHLILVEEYRNGARLDRNMAAYSPLLLYPSGPSRLLLQRIGGELALFQGERVLQVLKGLSSLHGRMGFTGETAQVFSGLPPSVSLRAVARLGRQSR